MSLLTKLQEDMKAALKAGQKERLSVLRMLISDVKNIDLAPQKMSEQDAVAAYARKLRKGQEEYEKLGRPDEAARLRAEAEIAESYLPKKLSAEETERLVEQFIAEHGFTGKQAGQAIGAFMKAHGGQVDGGLASGLIRKKLVP